MTPRDQIAILRCLQQRAELFKDIARLEAELTALLGDAAAVRALALAPPADLPSRIRGKRTVHALPDRKTPRRTTTTPTPSQPPLQEPFDRQQCDGQTPVTLVWTYQGQTQQTQQISPELIHALLQLPKDVIQFHVK